MLVAGLVGCEVRAAIAKSKIGMSVTDVLMEARAAKADSSATRASSTTA